MLLMQSVDATNFCCATASQTNGRWSTGATKQTATDRTGPIVARQYCPAAGKLSRGRWTLKQFRHVSPQITRGTQFHIEHGQSLDVAGW
jgi:hypothetical protein